MSATTAFLPCAITKLAFVNRRFAFALLSLSVPCRSSFAILSFSYGAMTATMSPSHFGHRIFAGRSRTTSRQDILQFRRSEEHTSELQSPCNLVCRLLLEKKKKRETRLRTMRRRLQHEFPGRFAPRQRGAPDQMDSETNKRVQQRRLLQS